MTGNYFPDDEAIARALQEQYSREFRASQQRSSSVPRVSQPQSAPVLRGRPVQEDSSSRFGRGDLISGRSGSSVRGQSSARFSSQGVGGDSFRAQPNPYEQPSYAAPRSSYISSTVPPAAPRIAVLPDFTSNRRRMMESANAPPPLSDAGSTRTSTASVQSLRQYDATAGPSAPPPFSQSLGRQSAPYSNSYVLDNNNNMRESETGYFVEENDAEYARRLQAEILEEEAVLRAANTRDISRKREDKTSNETPLTSRSNSEASGYGGGTDEEAAMRMQQEIYDEELARRMMQSEQDKISTNRVQQMAPQSEPSRCTRNRCIRWTVPILFLFGLICGILYYLIGRGSIQNIVLQPGNFPNEDPFNGTNPANADHWQTAHHGLAIEIVNALDSSWYPFFDLAVKEWDNGNPDALTLTTSVMSPDSACSAITGKIKVCNGNYGDTKWRGINKILLSGGYIIASTARMNEYYMNGADVDQKQYTMCHEIGHGFGLPHTDQSFTNPDLGNCMDYTTHPAVNMQPDHSNFVFLEEMYGTVPGYNTSNWNKTDPSIPTNPNVIGQIDTNPSSNSATANPASGSFGGTGGSSSNFTANNSSNPFGSGLDNSQYGSGIGSGNGNRLLDEIPSWVWHKWHSLEDELDNHSHGSENRSSWQLLHNSTAREAHRLDIGDGYTIEVHKVLDEP